MSEVDFESYLNDQLGAEPAAEEPAVEPDAPAEPEAEAEAPVDGADADERPRNEKGQFAPKDDVVEQRLKEKDRVIGSMAHELGELRKLVEERTEPQKPAVQQAAFDASAWQEAFDENPSQIIPTIQQAWQEDNRAVLYAGIAALQQYDAPRAEAIRVEVAKQDAKREMEAQFAPTIAASQENAQTVALNEANAIMASKHGDYAELIGALDPEKVEIPPRYLERLAASATAATKADALEDLYFWAAREVGGRRTAATAAAAAEDEQHARATKQQAAVASASSAPATEGTGDTELDAFHAAILAAASPLSRPAR